ncbi:MAG: conjugative transposon protein TraM [Bacteroidota bacterium]
MKPHSEKFLQKRRFFMVLPLLVLPFVTMIFWALGGGQGTIAQAHTVPQTGLNLSLPDAHFGEKEIWDKLALYEMAERDSAKYEEARESDPYFDLIAFKTQDQQPEKKDQEEKESKLISSFPQKERQLADPNEERVTRKLNELYKEINRPAIKPDEVRGELTSQAQQTDPQFTADVDRLEKMMEMMQDNGETDPEMQQIESVLEKILDIQHPERVKERLKSQIQEQKANSHPVEAVKTDDNISILNNKTTALSELLADSLNLINEMFTIQPLANGFFGLDDEVTQEQIAGNGIEAIIHDTQELVAGSTVKLRLLNDVKINGRLVPKDQFIYGTCAINRERLTIQINSIRTDNTLLPVALSVYDLDGLEGIYIPGAITRDAAKQASDDALQNIQLMSLDPSIGAQAAAAGVEAAKGLFSKKAKLVKVTVKAGYQVFLVDTNPTGNTTY